MSVNPIPFPKFDQPVTPPEDTARTPTELKYEIADDVLARLVFVRISAEAKARRRVEEFIRDRYRLSLECGQAGTALTADELNYIAPYVDVARIDAAEDAFVKRAQRQIEERRRRKSFLRWTGMGVLAILAMGIGVALWYARHPNKESIESRTATAPPAPQPIPSPSTGVTYPSMVSESGESVDSRRGTPQPPETRILAAKNAQAAAEQSMRSGATDAAVLARFHSTLNEHREALATAGGIASFEGHIRALENLLELATKADALAGSTVASLLEKRQADWAYVSRAREVRGHGADLARISRRIEEWDALLARHATVLNIIMCVQRKDRFCEAPLPSRSFRTGTKIFATVSLVAKTARQPVTFKWLRNGNVEREEHHTVEHSDSRGFRINGVMRPQRPGNWEFCVYSDAGRLITKVPFTVQ